MHKIIKNLIRIISIIGIITSGFLIYKDISMQGYCPKLMSIPACYLALVWFLLVLLSYFAKKLVWKEILFNFGAWPGLFMAIWFSIVNYNGWDQCPKFFNVPFCHISFLFFIFLIFLQWLRLRAIHNKHIITTG